MTRGRLAQLRSRSALEARLLQRAGRRAEGGRAAGVAAADALLLVSGSHPLRDLAAPARLAAGALDALRAAAALRAAGRLPRALSLWAVANPLTERAARVAAKARAPAASRRHAPSPSAIIDWPSSCRACSRGGRGAARRWSAARRSS